MSIDPGDQRLALVRAKADHWAKMLVDLSYRNTLLYFKNTKTASLDLTSADPVALDDLVGGGKVKLGSLITDPQGGQDACVRARSLNKKILLFREEQGVEVGKIALGLELVPAPQRKGTGPARPLRAPLLLRSVVIKARTNSENDFTLELLDDREINPVLLHALDQQYGIDIDRDAFTVKIDDLLVGLDDWGEQVEQVHRELAALAGRQGLELSLERAAVVGLFNYEKLPMVDDLNGATELLAEHDLIAAVAGDKAAAERLRSEAASFDPPRVDDIVPADEYLVQDADSSQHRAITTALAGHHMLIEGPPGTGKSQTIANIIAGAAAEGKTVLFVAEKRAALDAVTERLGQVDLDGLVFDLHQQKLNKRQIAQQLGASLDRAAKEPPVEVDGLHERMTDRRRRLLDYVTELHRPRDPWRLSAHQVQAQLLAIGGAYACQHTFRSSVLKALDAGTMRSLEQDIKHFVESGGLRILRRETPWWNATVREDNIEHVLAELDQLAGKTLPQAQDGMQRLVAQTGLAQPRDITGWQDMLALLDGVSRSVEAFGPEIFGTQLDYLYYATAARGERSRYPQQLPWKQRRALVKQARDMSRRRLKKGDLHDALAEVMRQRGRWQELGGSHALPSQVVGLDVVMRDYEELRRQLTSVALSARLQDLEHRPAEHVAHTLDELRDDKKTLWQLPKLTELRERFHVLGLDELVQEIAKRNAGAEQAWLILRHAWLRSLDEEFKLRVAELREFVGTKQTRLVAEFQAADVEHRESSARRVRRKVARALLQAKNDYPDEARTLRDQASKKSRHMPTRRLVEETSHVLLALRPCWAMSPLIVSRMLPAVRLFDLVIFDEASQIQPHDAITSIMRGRKLVVAGDENQLPPTSFFDRAMSGADEDDVEADGNLDDYESILTTLRSPIPNTQMLKWHYRSRDERLISFSNKEIYGDKLVTFPGATQDSPVSLDTVDGVSSPGQNGSAPAEVDRVVRLALEHAETRPWESLGVITMGTKHQARIEQRLREARHGRPELDEFFSDELGSGRRFFVKNLESVQGDERDAIILSVGVAKGANGRVSKVSFGPLNRDAGKRRLNVAITRAKKRMTVVASFKPSDLLPSEQVNGTELLRRYLEFAERGGEIDQVGRQVDSSLNGFEQSVLDALQAMEIPVYPQWGFSGYRIDFALAHRDDPGRMVLAVEADGDTYHRSNSARDRDRLRQAHLENLGWSFHRLWSSAWFADPETEAAKIVEAWEEAMVRADSEPEPVPAPSPTPAEEPATPLFQRGLRPNVPRGLKTHEYSDSQLVGLSRWLMTDGLLFDRDERTEQALRELGFQRRGPRIVERLNRAVEIAQHLADKEER